MVWHSLCVQLVALALVLVYVSWLWLKQRRVNLPPGPRPLPVIGSLHLLGSHAPRSLMKLSETYGPVMTVRFGQKLCIVASNSEAAREFLKVQDANFSSRPLLRATELMSAGGQTYRVQTIPILFHTTSISNSAIDFLMRIQIWCCTT